MKAIFAHNEKMNKLQKTIQWFKTKRISLESFQEEYKEQQELLDNDEFVIDVQNERNKKFNYSLVLVREDNFNDRDEIVKFSNANVINCAEFWQLNRNLIFSKCFSSRIIWFLILYKSET